MNGIATILYTPIKRILTIYHDGQPLGSTYIMESTGKRITTTWGTFTLRDDNSWRWIGDDAFTIKPEV